MQERHQNRKKYFLEQAETTAKFVIPYIEQVIPITQNSRVLEIGCGEGGNLVPFIERKCEVVGVDINKYQVENAKVFIEEHCPDNSKVSLITENIYNVTPEQIGTFDLIMLRDVIEHIPDQATFMKHLKMFLKPEGRVFFGFPPWYMPFGGHQQVCQHKLLSKLPYYHLLPKSLYKRLLKAFGENENVINDLIEIKETGISTSRFQRIVRQNGYKTDLQTHYLINPNYETKFGLKPRKQFKIIQAIPGLRDFFTTCMYSVISIDKK